MRVMMYHFWDGEGKRTWFNAHILKQKKINHDCGPTFVIRYGNVHKIYEQWENYDISLLSIINDYANKDISFSPLYGILS